MAAPALTTYVQGLGQVSADGLNTMMQTCDTFAQMRGLIGVPGMEIACRGGLTIADGLQGFFYWQAGNPGPDNGSTVIVPNGALLGAWVKLALVTNSNFPLGQVRFSWNSTTQVQLNPYNGNSIQIQGGVFQIPAAGIAAGNTGVFVNGAANQNLVSSTLYYVYVFSNAGTPTLDFSTTAYAQDTTIGNVGVYIKNSNPSRSLVGMVFTDASSHFNDSLALRNTTSWFNRQNKVITGSGTSGATTTSSTLVELTSASRVQATLWSEGALVMSLNGCAQCSGSANSNAGIGRDGATFNLISEFINPTFSGSSVLINFSCTGYDGFGESLAEGNHFYTPLGGIGSGDTLTTNFILQGMIWS